MDFGYILMYVVSFFGLFASTLFFLVFFDSKNLDQFSRKAPKKLPLISVIIPAYNSESGVVRSIKNVLSLEYPRNKLDIIVVDDGSTDKTYARALQFKNDGVRVFTLPHKGKASALNFGITKAKGDFIANLDADSFLDKNAFMKMIGFFDSPTVMGVTPSIKVHNPKTVAQKVQMLEFLSSAIMKKSFSYLGSLPIASGACTMFRREFFEKHGGYREDLLTEDGEMSMRLDNNGYSIECAMDVAVYTGGMPTYKRFFTQRLRWFRGLFDCLSIHRGLLNPRKGNIAVMILPLMLTSTMLMVISGFYGAYKFADIVWSGLKNLYLTGFDVTNFFDYSFDLFNINLGATTVLLSTLLCMSIVLLSISKHFANERRPIVIPYLYFFLTYGFVAFTCWSTAVYYKITGKKIKWGDRYL